jgi:HEXXH motif-containing protein
METESSIIDAACANLIRMRDRLLDARRAKGERLATAACALGGSPLPDLDPGDATVYAMLNHVFVQARHAATRHDRELAAAALQPWAEPARWTDRRPLVLAVAECGALTLDGMAEPAYCVRGPVAPEDPALAGIFAAARSYADRAGFGPLVETATGVVVVLGTVPAGASPVSFTMSFLPATSNLQLPATEAETGEILVHEAAHSWLNECLDVARVTVPATPLLPSPWKGVLRPPLAIVHSAFAFATVVRYLAACPQPPGGGYDTTRGDDERQIIVDHLSAIDDAIRLVPDGGIRDLVSTQVRLAVDG